MQIPFKNGKLARDCLIEQLPFGSDFPDHWIKLPGFDEEVPFWCRDTRHWLIQEYGSRERGEGFVLRGDFSGSFHDDAVCEEAFHGEVWYREEKALLDLDPTAYMAALELAADGTCVNRKGLSVHPIYATLRNRPRKVSC